MTTNYREISNTIWNIANHLHGTFKAYEYQDVILPLTVLKRLDDALEPTKQKTLQLFNELDGRVPNFNILYRTTGYNFYNISPYTFKKLLEAPIQAAPNLRKYIDGFSDNVKEIFAKFEFDRILDKLHESELLYLALKEFSKIDLHPDKVENHVIGLAFEDLIRGFAEQSNETAGEHYTPRDVVRLMTSLLFSGEEKELARPGVIKEIYDPACGTGGMLTVSKDYIQTNFNKDAHIFLYGQELNATTYAICKADMLIKGEDIDSIKGGDKEHSKASTLSNDQHHGQRFDYILSNPPFGVSWEKDKSAVANEAERGFSGRFGAGLPRISDAQFLFMQHVISKLKTKEEGGGEAAVVFNGSPLFTGDAGGGESEIRRWILENDLLDAIVALPEKLFFNTGISTYIWIFSTRKSTDRKKR
jgi:type I restriction enzyme M protein